MSKEEYPMHWRCRNCGQESPNGTTHCPNCHADLMLHGQQIFDDKKPPKSHGWDILIYGWSDIVAVDANTANSFGLRADGTVVMAGSNSMGQSNVGGWKDIKLPVK